MMNPKTGQRLNADLDALVKAHAPLQRFLRN